MVGKRTNFKDDTLHVVISTTIPEQSDQKAEPDSSEADISLPPNPANNKCIYGSKHLGYGIDPWVYLFARTLRSMMQSGRAPAGIVADYFSSIQPFITFLKDYSSSVASVRSPQSFNLHHAKAYNDWLANTNYPPKDQLYKAGRLRYFLKYWMARKIIPKNDELVQRRPGKPTQNEESSGVPAKPSTLAFSSNERKALLNAIQSDLIAIHHKKFRAGDSDAVTVYYLMTAMRTGLNTTPSLELERNALEPNPLFPKVWRLRTFKRRAMRIEHKNVKEIAMEDAAFDEAGISIPLDAVGIFKRQLEKSEKLVNEAPEHLKNRVWLFVARGVQRLPFVSCLDSRNLAESIGRFVRRHNLKGDDGSPLVVNTKRLRVTLEARLWELSDGNLAAVAETMNHSTKVADSNYLGVTDEMRAVASIVGEALPEIFRSGKDAREIFLTNTPVASCKDTKFGEKAPKDGEHNCADFLSCLTCRSFAVVETLKDLHRLYSFFWFLDYERENAKSDDWRDYYAQQMSMIDEFTKINFNRNLVAEAKELAKKFMHPFWKSYLNVRRQRDANGL